MLYAAEGGHGSRRGGSGRDAAGVYAAGVTQRARGTGCDGGRTPGGQEPATMGDVGLFTADREKYRTMAGAWVTPEAERCVQCGICSYHCPMEIDAP